MPKYGEGKDENGLQSKCLDAFFRHKMNFLTFSKKAVGIFHKSCSNVAILLVNCFLDNLMFLRCIDSFIAV